MLDYKNELGNFLTSALTIIKKSDNSISCDELSQKANVPMPMAKNILYSLLKRGLIVDNRGLWKNDDFEYGMITRVGWLISADGINYLENHRAWWKRFWVRSVICPLIVSVVVSFFTALVAPSVWSFINDLSQKM